MTHNLEEYSVKYYTACVINTGVNQNHSSESTKVLCQQNRVIRGCLFYIKKSCKTTITTCYKIYNKIAARSCQVTVLLIIV